MDWLSMNTYEWLDIVATQFGKINLERPDYKWKRPRYYVYSSSLSERKYIPIIIKLFSDGEWIRQYTVWLLNRQKNLRIDLYSEKYKLAIECDEHGHKYQLKQDAEREEYLKKVLGCTFIRFNPDGKDFDFEKVLWQINTFIKERKLGSI